MEQFSRTALLLREEGMARLKQARVAVFGVGGVGGFVCEALIRSGVGALDVIDNDTVSLTNLNRQLIATHTTIGQPKVEVMAARLHDIAPDAVITTHRMFYLPENAHALELTAYDYVVDAIDTLKAKLELITRCQAAGVPVISAMGAGNKLDPSCLRIADIYQTKACALARVMRKQCRQRGIQALKVAYSIEEPLEPVQRLQAAEGPRRDVPGSAMFVPAAMGLLIASQVVRELSGVAAQR